MNNDIIYHFTTLEAFYHIVTGGSLHMFDIIKSNDPKEGKFALECLDTVLNKSRYVDKVDLSDEQWIEFRKAFLELADDFKYPNPEYWMLCTSFCEIDENEQIPLWQIYGGFGKGVAIGIDKAKILQVSENIKIESIQYLTNDKMEQKALEFINENKNKTGEELCNAVKGYYIHSFCFKRKCFEYEHEVRLLAKSVDLSENMFCFDKEDEMVNFSFSNGRIKSYYNLTISKQNFDCISEVILGPSCPMSVKEMRFFLNKNCGRYVSVRKADYLTRDKE